MTQAAEKSALIKARHTAVIVLTIMLLGGASRLQAQALAAPGNMPILYQEIPGYAEMKPQARYKINLSKCTIAYKADGYYLISGDREFVILNQNPACLKRFTGKTVAVRGRTTENVVLWCRLYFVVVDEIDGRGYEGKVTPWMMRKPTDKEIRYWNLHAQLPPATQRFMVYLDLPKSERDLGLAQDGADSNTLAYCAVTPKETPSCPEVNVNGQLTAIQRQLTAIEQKMEKPPYRGVNSIPVEDWNTTDWSLYMDLQGAGG